MDVGAEIRRLRLTRRPRLTLSDLAGGRLSVSLISKIERGLVRPSLPTLEYLAAQLGTTAGELLGEKHGPGGDEELRIARATVALADEDPAGALTALDSPEPRSASLEERALRATALVALGRADEALRVAGVAGDRVGDGVRPAERLAWARVALARAEALASTGARDAAQEWYRRALGAAPAWATDPRAEALLGLARLAESTGAASDAAALRRHALVELALASTPGRRFDALWRQAEDHARAGDVSSAARAATAAAEIAALGRAARLRAGAVRLGPPVSPGAGPGRYPEAADATAQRSIRRDRNP